MPKSLWQTLFTLADRLDAAGVPYCFADTTALFIQQVPLPTPAEVEIHVQWDYFESLPALFQPEQPGPVVRTRERAQFRACVAGVPVVVACLYNTVVAADPNRVPVDCGERSLWVKSLLYCREQAAPDGPQVAAINARLAALQAELSDHNRAAWSQGSGAAWTERFGEPVEAAARIAADPAARLSPLLHYLGPLQERRVANLLGSHGAKAVAMALLGADVTVVDISPQNREYALRVAEAAGVQIRYLVADVLALPPDELNESYDLVLLELGVLHYFVDLAPLAAVFVRLLRPGGRLVLHDFHPFSTKLIGARGKKQKVTGNYFDPRLVQTEVAFTKYLPGGLSQPLQPALERRWTLGEVVTAVAEAGLFIRLLKEEPNTKLDDVGIPKTFTLVAERPAGSAANTDKRALGE